MSYPKKTFRMHPVRGLVFDIPANEVGVDENGITAYTAGSNVIFRDAFAQRTGGRRQVYTQNTVNPVWHLLNARIDTTNNWVVFGPDSVKGMETTNITDIEGTALTTATSPWQYSSTLLNRVPVFTNGLDTPQYWDGNAANNFTNLPGWPASTVCASIVAFKNFLFAFDIDGPSGHFEEQVLWSDAAEPGTVPATWDATATGSLAGDTILADTPGPIMLGVPLRGSLLIYKRSATYVCDFTGDTNVFSFRTLFTSAGALTRHSVCDINSQHFVVGDGDIYLTDGSTKKSVAQGRMKDYLFSTLDQTHYENLFVIYHRAKNEVWVCYPETGNTYCTAALVYDVANDAFGIRTLNSIACAAIGVVNDTSHDESWANATYTWDSATQYWGTANFSLAVESLIVGGNSDDIYMEDTDDATTVNASVGKYDITFGDPERVKFVKRVHVRAGTGSGTLYVRVGARMDPNDSITWAPEVALDTSTDTIVNAFAQGRYISVEIRSQDTDEWLVTGIDMEVEFRGYH